MKEKNDLRSSADDVNVLGRFAPDLRGLSLKQLRAFVAVARAGSMTAAANQLCVTPPAVTTHLKTIEKMIGAPLLDRSGDVIALTDVGRAMLTLTEEIETTLARGERKIAALLSGAEGGVALGAVSTAKYFTPSVVAAFQRAHPGVRVTLAIGNREMIVQGLERGEYDLAIMGRPPAHLDVSCAVLGDHPHELIAPPDHPLAGAGEVQPEDLLQETFLAREAGSGTRMLMARFLERIGAGRSARVVEMGTNETIKQAVIAGLGLAILSAHTCHVELQEGRLVALPAQGLPLIRQWYLLSRTERPLDRAAAVLRDFILARKADLLPVWRR